MNSQERLGVGIESAAQMEWMFEEAKAFVKERKAFGKTIISLQVSCDDSSLSYWLA